MCITKRKPKGIVMAEFLKWSLLGAMNQCALVLVHFEIYGPMSVNA